jgi:AraC family transcriptional regulator
MSRPNPLPSAAAFIESRLMEPLSLADIAEAAGMSNFHFSRLFTAACGESVMAYVRRQRLARAARRLAEEPRIALVDLAFDCGFESQQAFTRAFTRQFGVSPGRFRRPWLFPLGSKGDPLMSDAPSECPGLERLEGLKRLGPVRIAGLSGLFDADNMHAIPALWARFVPRLPVAGQRGQGTFGVCVSGSPDTGDFRYMAGAELEPGAPAPEGLEVVEVPAQSYAAWRLTLDGGPLHPQMQAAARDIWGRRLAAEGLKPSGGSDFEVYPPGFDQTRPGATVEFWVPVAT